jgi:hypothetical protein
MTEHTGTMAGSSCAICGPAILAARKANQVWTSAQLGGRGTAPYRRAFAAAQEAAADLLAAKREHYADRN